MKRLAIIGSEDLAQQVRHYAEESGHWKVVGYFDDTKNKGENILGVPIMGTTSEIADMYEKGRFDSIFVAVGYKHMDFRRSIFENFKTHIPFANIIHPHAYIDPSVTMGVGIIVMPGVTIEMNARIEDNIMLYSGVTLAHDTHIGAHSFLAPRVCLAGFASIGSSCFLGINTTVIDHVRLSDHVRTGAGTVVVSDINISGLYVGNPHHLVHSNRK